MFIFTFKGNLTIRVEFNETFWNKVLNRLVWFWKKIVSIELLTGTLKQKLQLVYKEGDMISVKKPALDIQVEDENHLLSQAISDVLEIDMCPYCVKFS